MASVLRDAADDSVGTATPSPPGAPIQAGTPRISADWLAWPTLSESPSGPDVVGANFHKAELAVIMDFWGPLFMTELVVGPKGEFSRPVYVVVGGIVIGNVPHRIAEGYRQAVYELHRSGKRALCRVSATPGPVAPLLLIHGAPRARRLGDPFLPPTGSGEPVVLDPEGTGRMEAMVRQGGRKPKKSANAANSEASAAHGVATATLVPRIDRLDVQLDGQRVGHLTNHYPLIEKAARFEYPLTCRATVQPGVPGFGLRVFVPR